MEPNTLTRETSVDGVVAKYLNPLPRTIARSGETLLLDGIWNFELDLHNRGLKEHWEKGHTYAGKAHWPGSLESQIEEGRALPWEDEIVAWYEREFEVPGAWNAELVQVTFGAVGYETRVWLNGVLLPTVEGEFVHYGEYTSFSYELPAGLLQPVNRLTVRIADSLDSEIPRGKQASRIYKRGGIWYQATTGPSRSVWLEVVECNRLRSYLAVTSHIESKVVTFELTTRVHDAGRYQLKLLIQPADDDTPLVAREWPLDLEVGTKPQKVSLVLPEAQWWSPAAPNLYRITAQLVSTQGDVSQISARWGMRKIETRGPSIYLNNEPIYLDGILYQPIGVTWEQIKLHLEAMIRLGCNLVRIHIAGIDPRVYDLADELGLLLWVEIPSPHSSSARSRENHWAELQRMERVIGSHPSVVVWSMYNEDWGAQDIAENPETQAYIQRCYEYLAIKHPHLLVVDNDGWRHVSRYGELQSDLLTAHIYQNTQQAWEDVLDRLCRGDVTVTAESLIVGDPYFYEGQTPIVVSEWGGFGFEGYGGPVELDTRADQIVAYKQALRARPIAGDVYTQATNIEEERNGLIDVTTGELMVPPDILRSQPPL
jgi:beta-galactosidase/beta-glucuronidase